MEEPQTKEEYENRRAELIEESRELKQELDAKQSEMLDAVTSGEDGITVEKYETVRVGEVDVEVKAWMPGSVQDEIMEAKRLADRENIRDARESVLTMVEGMSEVTTQLSHEASDTVYERPERIRKFWKGMYDEWGADGFQQAASRVLEPASEDLEEKSEAVDGFRQDASRSSPSDYSS